MKRREFLKLKTDVLAMIDLRAPFRVRSRQADDAFQIARGVESSRQCEELSEAINRKAFSGSFR